MAAKKGRWGGPRKGGGRRPGSGKPAEAVRRNRVTVTLTDADLEKLKALAAERDLPTGTAAYEIVSKVLRRRP